MIAVSLPLATQPSSYIYLSVCSSINLPLYLPSPSRNKQTQIKHAISLAAAAAAAAAMYARIDFPRCRNRIHRLSASRGFPAIAPERARLSAPVIRAMIGVAIRLIALTPISRHVGSFSAPLGDRRARGLFAASWRCRQWISV